MQVAESIAVLWSDYVPECNAAWVAGGRDEFKIILEDG